MINFFPIQTAEFTLDGIPIKVHGIRTGTVQVKKSHREPSQGMLQIMVDLRWAKPMPIYAWLIEHPEGNILIDTGENVQVKEDWYFDCDPTVGFANKKILKFEIEREMEIGRQLYYLGFETEEIDWVILTHLHIDHIDGLMYFPRSEVIVSQAEWERPFGAMKCLLPPGMRPNKIIYESDPVFIGQYPLTSDGRIRIISTPGHTHGHQSVLLETDTHHLFFAGDTSFDQDQLLNSRVGGIHADKKASLDTYKRILKLASLEPLIYLPSHDWKSGERLVNGETCHV